MDNNHGSRPQYRNMSDDCRNLVITSLSKYSDTPPVAYYNGKNKLRTGLVKKSANAPNLYFNRNSEVSGIYLRSYNSTQAKDLNLKQKIFNRRKEMNCSMDLNEYAGGDFLIVKQSKIALYEEYNARKKKLKNLFLNLSRSPLSKNQRRKLTFEKICVKEAVKDKEWLASIRPKIQNSFGKLICKSNGLEISVNSDSYYTFKYCLGQGNNSKLVKQVLAKRWWWSRVPIIESSSVNLCWTQWRSQSFLDRLESCTNTVPEKLPARCNLLKSEVFYFNALNSKKIVDFSYLNFELITKSPSFMCLAANSVQSPGDLQIHNRIDMNFLLSNKKALYYNMKRFYQAVQKNVFDYLPVTFHVNNEDDLEFNNFLRYYSTVPNSLWIIKPGENSNRGNGITLANTIEDIKKELRKNPFPLTGQHTYILQKYLETPYLLNKRKFDIRCYTLLTSINGIIQCYFYEEGYLRTSSKKFNCDDLSNLFIHLTNDAIQKKSENYGKFESGNKISYNEFQKYLDSNYPKKIDFFQDVLQGVKEIVKDTVKAVFLKIDPSRKLHSFEIFGYDFMLDEELRPWLIEVNTNPCLELSCSHLARIIPSMLDNAFRICLDPLFPEPCMGPKRVIGLVQNKFELIFHSLTDGEQLIQSLKENNMIHLIQELDFCIAEIQETMLNESTESLEDLQEIL